MPVCLAPRGYQFLSPLSSLGKMGSPLGYLLDYGGSILCLPLVVGDCLRRVLLYKLVLLLC
jgi:hypothetical protein